MAVNINRGVRRIFFVLTLVMLAMTLRTEIQGHDQPFLKNFDWTKCALSEPFVKVKTEFAGAVIEKILVPTVEMGYITESEACHDISLVITAGSGAKLEPPGSPDGKLKIADQRIRDAQAEKFQRMRALRNTVASGRKAVPLYGRLDWEGLSTGALGICGIWLVYAVGLFIVRGFVDTRRDLLGRMNR